MKRARKTAVAGLAALAFVVAATPASAISDEQACVDAGGTYVKKRGTASCQFPVGNSHNVKTISQKGSSAAATRKR